MDDTGNPHDRMRYLNQELAKLAVEVSLNELPETLDRETPLFFHRGHIAIRFKDTLGDREVVGYSIGSVERHNFIVGTHKEAAEAVNLKMWQFLQSRGIPAERPKFRRDLLDMHEQVDFEDLPLSQSICAFMDSTMQSLKEATDAKDWTEAIMALCFAIQQIEQFETRWRHMELKHNPLTSLGGGLWWPGHCMKYLKTMCDRIRSERENPLGTWTPSMSTPEQNRGLWILVNMGGGNALDMQWPQEGRANIDWLILVKRDVKHYLFKTPALVEMAKQLELQHMEALPQSYFAFVKAWKHDNRFLERKAPIKFSTASAFYASKHVKMANSPFPWERDLARKYASLHTQALQGDPDLDPLYPGQRSPLWEGQRPLLLEEL